MDSKTTSKLLKIVLLSIAISFVIDKVVFFGMNKISDKVMTGQAIGKLNHFLSVKDSVDVLVFGNSRANHHINAEELNPNSFNNGTDGISIAYNSTLINTLDKSIKQLVIVHIDTKNFFDDNYKGTDIRSLKTKYLRNDSITSYLEQSKTISILQNFYYSMNYNGNVLGILKNYLNPSYNYKTYNGYDPLTVSESQEKMRDIVLSKDSKQNCSESLSINPIALDYLKKIKHFSEESSKRFVFVTTPFYNDQCKADNKTFATLMTELGLNYFDYSDLFISENDNSLWKDKTHLSARGAEAFTTYFIQEVKDMY